MKIKNLLVALTAACLFATSFNAFSDEKTFQNAIKIMGNAESGSALVVNPPVRAIKGKAYYLVATPESQFNENESKVTILAKSDGKLFYFYLLKPTLQNAEGNEENRKYLEVIYNHFMDNAKMKKPVRIIGLYEGPSYSGWASFKVAWAEPEGSNLTIFEPVTPPAEVEKPAPETKAPETQPAPTEEKTTEESEQDYCKNAYATGNMPGMIECEGDALIVEDKRLNQEYKTVMPKLDKDQKKALRTKQRAWIKDRDKACKAEEDGGQAAELDHVSCLKEWTKKRADELAAMR